MSARVVLDPGREPPVVVVGSTSPAKRLAVTDALRRLYGRPVDVLTVAADPGVPAQPWGEEETRTGALNRARGALQLAPNARLAIGIEAGVSAETGWPLWTFAWIVALSQDGVMGAARSATFGVPERLAAGVRSGLELGDALDEAYGSVRAKDGPGAVGILTRGLLDRPELYASAVLLALLPWLEPS